MAALTEDTILSLAGSLLDNWTRAGIADSLGKIDVANAVKSLIANRFLSSSILGALTPDLQADLIKDSIKLFQRAMSLTPDGVLNSTTLKRLNSLRGSCEDTATKKDSLPPDVAAKVAGNEDGIPPLVHFFVRPSVPKKMQGHPTLDLLVDALQAWTTKLHLAGDLVDTEQEANVVIEWGRLDGTGPTLAIAHVGGPRQLKTNRLTLTFDQDENFISDKQKFLGTACHELGHILGLDHIPTSGQLMSAIYNPAILEPTANDIARMQAIWGPSRD